MACFALGAGVCGYGTIAQFVFGSNIIPGTAVTNAGRFAGLAQNVSDTGGICCVGAIAAIAGLAAASRRRQQMIALIAIGGNVLGLILSGSVSGMIAAVVGLVVLALLRVIRLSRFIAIAVAGSALIGIATAVQVDAGALTPLERLAQATGGGNANYDTAASRADTYATAIQKIQDSPLVGAGLDPTSTVVDGRYPAHNLFIAAEYEGGALLLLGMILALLWAAARAVKARRDLEVRGAMAATSVAVVFAMTAPSIFNRYFWIPVALMILAAIQSAGTVEHGIGRASRERQAAR